MDSLAAAQSKLQSAWEQFSNSVIDSDLVKIFLGAGTNILKVLSTDLGTVITQFGLLSGVGTGAVALIGQFGKNLTAAIPSLTGVGKALSSLTASAPLVATGLAALSLIIAPIISEMMGLKSLSSETFDQLQNSLQRANEQFENTKKTTQATAETALEYVDRLEELDKQTKRTVDEQYEYERVIESLNSLFPELNLKIDANTGKLNTQTSSIREQITAWEDLATAQAMQELRQAKLTAKLEAQTSLSAKKFEQSQLQTQFETLKEGGVKGYAEQTGKSAYAWSTLLSYRREGNILSKKISSLDKDIDSTQKLLDAAEQEYQAIQRESEQYLIEQKRKEETRASRGKRAQQQTPQAIDIAGTTVEGIAGSGYYDISAYAKDFTFDYSSWLKEQQHALNTGKIQEADYYASLQAMLDKYTEESIISTDDRWKAEEAIYKYKQNLTKQQQKDYEQAVKDAKTAAKEEYQTQKQTAQNIRSAFSAWQDEQDYLLTIGEITESEYYDNLKKKNEEYFAGKEEYLSEYWTNLEKIYKWESEQLETQFDTWQKAQEHRLAMGEITESEYYTELKKMNEQYFADNEKYLDKYWKNEEDWYKWKKQQIEDIHTATEDALDAEIEKEKEKLQLKKTAAETRKAELEAQQKELEQLSKYAQKIADEQIDAIDDKISALKDDADAITKKYKDQIDALEEQNQAIDDQINKQKLLEALAKAQQSKKYVFKDGRFQYVSDVDAINEAQSQLDEFNREQALQERTKQLEKQRDLELEQNDLQQKMLEEEKKRWQEYKTGWSNLTDAYDDEQNELLALQKLGIDIEKATWDERLSNLDSFRQQYIDLAKQIKEAEAEIAGYDTSISNVDSAEMRDTKIREMMKANSAAWHETTDESERERLHEANNYLNSLLSNQGIYNEASGKWSNLSYQSANSGLNAQSVLSGLPMMSTPQTPAAAIMASGLDRIKQSRGQVINLGNVTLPGVTNAKQFVSDLKNMALQAAYSRG